MRTYFQTAFLSLLIAVSAHAQDWAKQAESDAKEDRRAIIFDGKSPNRLACDTTLREMPDGSWVTIMLGGGDKEPLPENRIWISRSTDQGQHWSAMTPVDLGFKNQDPNTALVPTELMVHNGICTLFFATHDGHFGNWKCWFSTSTDSCRSWGDATPAPGKLHKSTFIRNHIVTQDGRILLPFQHYEGAKGPHDPRNGVLVSHDKGETWEIYGWIRLTEDDAYRGWAENNIVELSDGTIAMMIRADNLGGVLYRADSPDGGKSWPDFAEKTNIPNPGSKATLYPLGGSRFALLHNPNPHERNPLALWISFDDLKTWTYQRVLDNTPGRLNYPDGFVSKDRRYLHFAFDDNRHRAVYIGARLPLN